MCPPLRLLDDETVGFDEVVQNPGAAGRQGLPDAILVAGLRIAEQAAAAARAADLRGRRTRFSRARDQLVDLRRRHARRQPLAVLPLMADLPAHLVPLLAFERGAHPDGRI